MTSLTLSDLTKDPVEMRCRRCDRHGRYHKATLTALDGVEASTALPDIANAIAKARCKEWSELGNARCGVYFMELAVEPYTPSRDRSTGSQYSGPVSE